MIGPTRVTSEISAAMPWVVKPGANSDVFCTP